MLKVSIISPFYNEAFILEKSILYTLNCLDKLPYEWEWILVNDGSTDDSLSIAHDCVALNPRLKVITYAVNRGRGYALRMGIEAARGEIVVTTEADSSWGDNIVPAIMAKFRVSPGIDAVFASPHLSGGGYKNIPWRRVVLSVLGNKLIQLFFTKKVTMHTGMTRGYKREIIQNLTLEANGKEFHLEVLLKLFTMGYQIEEIPAVLEWKEGKFLQGAKPRRRRSQDSEWLIYTHLLFSAFANPLRYFWLLSLICSGLGTYAMGWGLHNMMIEKKAAWLILLSLLFFVVALLFFGFGIMMAQNRSIEKECWRIQMALAKARNKDDATDAPASERLIYK